MNITQYKDGGKSVKTFSLSELVDTMKDRASGRAVEEFREKLEECPPGCPCPAASKLPRIVFGAEYRKKNGEMKMAAYNGLVLLEVRVYGGDGGATEGSRFAANTACFYRLKP